MDTADASLITPGEAARTARSLAALLPASLIASFDASFIRSDHLFDEFVARLALRVLRDTGLVDAARELGSAAELAARAGLDPARAAVPVDWMLRRLEARGLMESTAPAGERPRFRARAPLPDLDPAPVYAEQMREAPSWRPSYVLAETAAADYPAFLRGERSGEALLFSPTRLRLWAEFFSNDNGLYAVNNRVGAVAAEQCLPAGEIRILELGGGLGSAAIALLDHLQATGHAARIGTYRFTDVASVFLRRGQEAVKRRFGAAPYFEVATLDMDRPLEDQGVKPASWSLVYAVNTVHVARDLAFTLGELRTALAPDGRLVISECIRLAPEQPVHAEFVFNLLEAFRSPVLHPRYRPNGGFLLPQQWREALETAGFVDVRCVPDIERLRDAVPNFSVTAVCARRQ